MSADDRHKAIMAALERATRDFAESLNTEPIEWGFWMWPGGYGLPSRLAFYVLAVIGGGVLGAALACGCNELAPLFGAHRGPWLELLRIGGSCGGAGAAGGALLVFAP